jgi:hypothetical protein
MTLNVPTHDSCINISLKSVLNFSNLVLIISSISKFRFVCISYLPLVYIIIHVFIHLGSFFKHPSSVSCGITTDSRCSTRVMFMYDLYTIYFLCVISVSHVSLCVSKLWVTHSLRESMCVRSRQVSLYWYMREDSIAAATVH